MSRFSNIAHYQDFTELQGILSRSENSYDLDKIEAAYKFAEKSHGDQRRVSGIPYILHPTSVACIVAELGLDTDSICAALLHDVVEDTPVKLGEIRRLFDDDVAKLIDGVTKLSKIPYSTREEQQAENIRKMLIAMSEEIRVIIIKLADRLHNMRTMDCMPEQKRRDKSVENMQVYAPIAHRLGIKRVKEELEDRSLQYLDPIGYEEIENNLLMNEDGRAKFIDSIKKQILEKTKDTIPNVYISGRVKSINSIYRKTFDPKTKTFGEKEMVYDAAGEGKSATIPRISPDGRYLLFGLGEFGCFHIWHPDADLYLTDLTTMETRPLKEANSDQAESYHVWSSNGRWIMFATRRDDGNYSRLYISYFDKNGKAHKPFEVPQKDPDFYKYFLKSYNVPEFMVEPVSISPQEFFEKAMGEAQDAKMK